MADCGNCGGCTGCGGCSGCGAIELTEGEVNMLHVLAQIPFLPVARRMDQTAPVYLEQSEYAPEMYSRILQCLEKRGLISIDYDKPLKGFDYSAYAPCQVFGSFALTQRGQQAAQLLDVQGVG